MDNSAVLNPIKPSVLPTAGFDGSGAGAVDAAEVEDVDPKPALHELCRFGGRRRCRSSPHPRSGQFEVSGQRARPRGIVTARSTTMRALIMPASARRTRAGPFQFRRDHANPTGLHMLAAKSSFPSRPPSEETARYGKRRRRRPALRRGKLTPGAGHRKRRTSPRSSAHRWVGAACVDPDPRHRGSEGWRSAVLGSRSRGVARLLAVHGPPRRSTRCRDSSSRVRAGPAASSSASPPCAWRLAAAAGFASNGLDRPPPAHRSPGTAAR